MDDEFLKQIKIAFGIEETSYNRTQKLIEDLGKTITFDFPDETAEAIRNLQEEVAEEARQTLEDSKQELQDLLEGLAKGEITLDDKVKEQISDLTDEIQVLSELLEERDEKEREETLAELFKRFQKNDFGNEHIEYLVAKLKALLKKLWEDIKETIKESWEELSNVLNYSLLTDSQIRESKFTYGFSDAEAYAFDMAKNLLGIKDEDLYYMSEEQWSKFTEKFNEYATRYDNLYDAGFFKTLQEYNWATQEFEEDLQYSIMQFFVDNKDLIIDVLHATMDFTEGALQALSSILKKLTPIQEMTAAERAAAISQVINSQQYSSKSLNMTNNINTVASETDLVNSLGIAFQQGVRMLGG